MSKTINPNNTWRLLDERIAKETDPIVKRNLEMVRKHAVAEATCDLEALMATVSEKAHYRCYTSSEPRLSPKGKDAVRQFYVDFVAGGATHLEHNVERIVADRWNVLTEGVMRMAYPGKTLQAMGVAGVDDPGAFYLMETRMAIVWGFDEHGLVTCEDSYSGPSGFEGIASRKLRAEDMLPIAA